MLKTYLTNRTDIVFGHNVKTPVIKTYMQNGISWEIENNENEDDPPFTYIACNNSGEKFKFENLLEALIFLNSKK